MGTTEIWRPSFLPEGVVAPDRERILRHPVAPSALSLSSSFLPGYTSLSSSALVLCRLLFGLFAALLTAGQTLAEERKQINPH